MRFRIFSILLIGAILNTPLMALSNQNKKPRITFQVKNEQKRINVMVNDQLFTAYIWPDNVMKPVLYPVNTSAGTEVTRGYPMQPRAGERIDHPHHIGIWFNYGDVDGFDFWNNSTAIPAEKKSGFGTIRHVKVEKTKSGKGEALLITRSSWVGPKGDELLAEKTEFHFWAAGNTRIIDRVATLTATNKTVSLTDNKEGVFAIRVARQLELPSKDEVIMTDAKGNPTTVKKMTNDGVSGSYRSSEGIKDDAVWSTRARWMDLNGTIGSERIALVIIDHPKNQSYPTYWHARGYGLFAANPLGWSVFTKGKENLNFSIQSGTSVVFRYRLVIHSGSDLSDAQIDQLAKEFGEKY